MRRNLLGSILLPFWCITSNLHAVVKSSDFLETLKEIPLTGEHVQCSRGTPYSFFFAKGTNNKILIDFTGGGACWNGDNCDHESKTFLESIEEFKVEFASFINQGIYIRSQDENPFKDWNHIIIPYCTGDLHFGSHDQAYTNSDGHSFLVHHQGATNVRAVLKWIQENFQNPENVFVTGTSGGAYASIFWFPDIRDMFPQTPMTQMGDSGISPITSSFAETAYKAWDVSSNIPKQVPGLYPDVDWTKLQITDLYDKIAKKYSDVNFGQYTSAYDSTQRFFFHIMGGDDEKWHDIIDHSLKQLASTTPNFKYFVAPGADHCILPFPQFYTVKSSRGYEFRTWLTKFLNGEAVENIDCIDCKNE